MTVGNRNICGKLEGGMSWTDRMNRGGGWGGVRSVWRPVDQPAGWERM